MNVIQTHTCMFWYSNSSFNCTKLYTTIYTIYEPDLWLLRINKCAHTSYLYLYGSNNNAQIQSVIAKCFLKYIKKMWRAQINQTTLNLLPRRRAITVLCPQELFDLCLMREGAAWASVTYAADIYGIYINKSCVLSRKIKWNIFIFLSAAKKITNDCISLIN